MLDLPVAALILLLEAFTCLGSGVRLHEKRVMDGGLVFRIKIIYLLRYGQMTPYHVYRLEHLPHNRPIHTLKMTKLIKEKKGMHQLGGRLS